MVSLQPSLQHGRLRVEPVELRGAWCVPPVSLTFALTSPSQWKTRRRRLQRRRRTKGPWTTSQSCLTSPRKVGWASGQRAVNTEPGRS